MKKNSEDLSQQVVDGQEQDSIDIEEKLKEKIMEEKDISDKLIYIAINSHLSAKHQLDDQLELKLKNIEIDYVVKAQPILQRISQIINGSSPILPQELAKADLSQTQHTTKHNYLQNQKFNKYWLKVLQNSEFAHEIQENDIPILQKLIDIKGQYNQTRNKLKIQFFFDQNPYFKNKSIVKTYQLIDGQPVKSQGPGIQWKDGKNITVKIVKKKKNKKKVTKQVQQPSFFNNFKNLTEQNQTALMDQFSLMQSIYLQIVPRSLEYFLGVALDSPFIDEDDDIDQDQDDQEDEQQRQKSKSKSKDKNNKRKKSKEIHEDGKQKKQECKQQ